MSNLEEHQAFRWDRTVFYICIIALLALAPLTMYRTYRVAVGNLCAALSRGAGMTVTLDDLWITAAPAVVLHRVKVSAPGLTLTADRLVLELDPARLKGLLSGGASTGVIRAVRARRPRLAITAAGIEGLARHGEPAKASVASRPGGKAGSPLRGKAKVIIEDGELTFLVGPRWP